MANKDLSKRERDVYKKIAKKMRNNGYECRIETVAHVASGGTIETNAALASNIIDELNIRLMEHGHPEYRPK